MQAVKAAHACKAAHASKAGLTYNHALQLLVVKSSALWNSWKLLVLRFETAATKSVGFGISDGCHLASNCRSVMTAMSDRKLTVSEQVTAAAC
jgi:hypothetical protein